MKELSKYYEENICPYCLNYQTQNCNKNISKKEINKLITILCHSFLNNKQKDTNNITETHEVYTLPKKYYFKNFREI